MPSRLSQFTVVALRADDTGDDGNNDDADDDGGAAAPQGLHSLVALRIMVRDEGWSRGRHKDIKWLPQRYCQRLCVRKAERYSELMGRRKRPIAIVSLRYLQRGLCLDWRWKIRDFLSFRLHELGWMARHQSQENVICTSQPTVRRAQHLQIVHFKYYTSTDHKSRCPL